MMAVMTSAARREPEASQAVWDLRKLQSRLLCETEFAGRRGWAIDVGYGKTLPAMMLIRWSSAESVLWIGSKNSAQIAFPAEVEKWRVIDPKSVRVLTAEDFGREAKYDFDGRVTGLQFTDRKATKAHILALAKEFRVLVVGYQLLDALAAALGATRLFDLVIFDEAQYLKNGGRQGSQRFKAGAHLSKGAKQVVAMTGTAQTASFEELWALAFILDFGEQLGSSLTQFRETYMVPERNGFGFRIRDDEAAAEVRDRFAQLWTGIRPDERLELPELVINDIVVRLPPATAQAATKLMRGLLAQIGDATVLPSNVAAGLEKALQLCHGFSYREEGGARKAVPAHNEKFDALMELLDSGIEGGVLLFFNHNETRDKLVKLLGKRMRLVSEPGSVDDWNAGKFQVLAGHPASLSEGLNLQHGGNNIIWFGMNWSLNFYKQGLGRMHRSGQTKPVLVHRIIADHAVERAVCDALDEKAGLLEALNRRLAQ